jgi:hypothetical protein
LTVAILWLPVLTFGRQLDALPDAGSDLTKWALLVFNLGLTVSLVALAWRRDVRRLAMLAMVTAGLSLASTAPGIAAGLNVDDAARRAAVEEDNGGGPDIYYIVLDAYARADVLAEIYGHDNGPFLDGLRARGFYIGDDSYSNYSMTHLSLAATLEMKYLPSDAPYDPAAIDQQIQDARVVHELQRRGYRYVFFETSWFGTDHAPLADVSVQRADAGTEFESILLRTTLPGRFLPQASRHVDVLRTFEGLRGVPEIGGPKFTFAHLLVPHPPLMFRSDGTVRSYVDDLRAPFEPNAYVDQLQFVNAKVKELIGGLISSSDTPPIIILQADHGPATLIDGPSDALAVYRERHGILNAIYAPDTVQAELYPSISPVNTFRVIMRTVFGEDMPNLPDRSFYNWYNAAETPAVADDPLQLRDVTDALRCNQC